MSLVNIDAGKITDIVQGIIARVWPDHSAEQKAALDRELQSQLAQLSVNAEEAKAGVSAGRWGAFFIAGWRPAVGWACCVGLVLHFTGAHVLDHDTQITLMEILGGLAGLRTIEKGTNTEGNR